MANTIPNFDAMTEEELMAFWSRYRRGNKNAEKLIGDRRKGYTLLAAKLASYACNKSVAMHARIEGKIDVALSCEDANERIYQHLPSDLKW